MRMKNQRMYHHMFMQIRNAKDLILNLLSRYIMKTKEFDTNTKKSIVKTLKISALTGLTSLSCCSVESIDIPDCPILVPPYSKIWKRQGASPGQNLVRIPGIISESSQTNLADQLVLIYYACTTNQKALLELQVEYKYRQWIPSNIG